MTAGNDQAPWTHSLPAGDKHVEPEPPTSRHSQHIFTLEELYHYFYDDTHGRPAPGGRSTAARPARTPYVGHAVPPAPAPPRLFASGMHGVAKADVAFPSRSISPRMGLFDPAHLQPPTASRVQRPVSRPQTGRTICTENISGRPYRFYRYPPSVGIGFHGRRSTRSALVCRQVHLSGRKPYLTTNKRRSGVSRRTGEPRSGLVQIVVIQVRLSRSSLPARLRAVYESRPSGTAVSPRAIRIAS